jgi:hypothetical protein
MLASHYAPRAKLRLNATEVRPGEALLAFGPGASADACLRPQSQSGRRSEEAAVNLFAMLRSLDRTGAGTIAVMPIPDRDLGEAINDRLERAAPPARRVAGECSRLFHCRPSEGRRRSGRLERRCREIAPHLAELAGPLER